MCNCNFVHRVTSITPGTANVALAVTDDTNIGNMEPFIMLISKCKSMQIAAAPLPVVVNVNGTSVPVLDRNGQQVMSNVIPRKSEGIYIETSNTTTVTAPYVLLYTTPCCRRCAK